MPVERVAECSWNQWPNGRGMGGRITVEFALEAFLAWAEIDLDLPGLQRLKHRFSSPCQVNSRENIRVVNGLNIVTFQYRFEFRFSGELADKIALFIGLYGSHAMGIAA